MIYERKKQLGLLDDTLVGSVYNNYVNNGNSRTDLSTAGGIHSGKPKGDAAKRLRHNAAMDYYKSQTHDAKPKQSAWVEAKKLADKITQRSSDQNIGKAFQTKNQIDQNAQALAKKPMTSDKAYSGGSDLKLHGGDEQDQQKWWQQLAAKMGLDFDKAAANWKDKGGFEGLMANPAFTMGLAFMQAGAEGKTLGEGALDNVLKAGKISQHYKKILEDRKQEPIEVTATDVGEVKSLLQTMNISSPSNVEKFWGFLGGKKNMQFKWDLASEEIAVELQKEIKKLKENKKPGAPEVVYDTPMKLKILKRMFNEGRFKKEGGTWFTDATLQTTQEIPDFLDNRAEGGPVQAGQPYVVGEEGPEVIIPHSSGNVLSNDDSQIYAMLLAANPQLQKVSKTRAERILRSRFPEYFE